MTALAMLQGHNNERLYKRPIWHMESTDKGVIETNHTSVEWEGLEAGMARVFELIESEYRLRCTSIGAT